MRSSSFRPQMFSISRGVLAIVLGFGVWIGGATSARAALECPSFAGTWIVSADTELSCTQSISRLEIRATGSLTVNGSHSLEITSTNTNNIDGPLTWNSTGTLSSNGAIRVNGAIVQTAGLIETTNSSADAGDIDVVSGGSYTMNGSTARVSTSDDLDVATGGTITATDCQSIAIVDDMKVSRGGTVTIGAGAMTLGDLLHLDCVESGGTSTAASSFSFAGASLDVGNEIYVGVRAGPIDPGSDCVANLDIGAGVVTARSIGVRGGVDTGTSIFRQTGGAITLTGAFEGSGSYGFTFDNSAAATLSGGSLLVNQSALVPSSATLLFPSGAAGASLTVTNQMVIDGTTNLYSGTLDTDGTLIIADDGLLNMDAVGASTGTVLANNVFIDATASGIGELTLAQDADLDGFDVIISGTLYNEGAVLITDDVDVSIGGTLTNDDDFWGVTEIAGTAEVSAAGIDNFGTVSLLDAGRFIAFSTFDNEDATFTHDSSADSSGVTFNNNHASSDLSFTSSGNLMMSGQFSQIAGTTDFTGNSGAVLSAQSGARISGGSVDLVTDAGLLVNGHPSGLVAPFLNSSLMIEQDGVVTVSGGTLTVENDITINDNSGCGLFVVNSGFVNINTPAGNIDAQCDAVLNNLVGFSALGGTFSGGGILARSGANVRIEGANVSGSFDGALTVLSGGKVSFYHGNSVVGPEIAFAADSTISGQVDHGEGTSAGDVGFSGQLLVDGRWWLRDDGDTNEPDLIVGGLLAVDDGEVWMGELPTDGSEVWVQAHSARLDVGSSSIDVDGRLEVTTGGMVQNGGELLIDSSTGNASFANAGGSSYTISGGDLSISDGSFSSDHAFSATGGTIDLDGGTLVNSGAFSLAGSLLDITGGSFTNASTFTLTSGDLNMDGGSFSNALAFSASGGGIDIKSGIVALTVDANSDASLTGTVVPKITGASVSVARDLLLGADISLDSTPSLTIGRTIEIAALLTITDTTGFSADSMTITGTGKLDFSAASPGFALSFPGIVPDTRAQSGYCHSTSDMCSIEVTSADTEAIKLGGHAVLETDYSFYAAGNIRGTKDTQIVVNQRLVGRDNTFYLAAGSELYWDGLLHAADYMTSLGTLIATNAESTIWVGRDLTIGGGTATFGNGSEVTVQQDFDITGGATATFGDGSAVTVQRNFEVSGAATATLVAGSTVTVLVDCITLTGAIVNNAGILDVIDDLRLNFDSLVTNDGEITIGDDLHVIDARLLSNPGSVTTVADLVWLTGSSGNEGWLDVDGGDLTFAYLQINSFGDLDIADGVVVRSTAPDLAPTAALGLVSGEAANLSVFGTLDLISDSDGLTDGVLESGSNLAIDVGGTMTVGVNGIVNVHRDLHVRGVVTNNGRINVSRREPGTGSSVGCFPSAGCVQLGSFTNNGEVNLGSDLDVYGTFNQAAGELNLGCWNIPDVTGGGDCAPSGDDTHDGALHVAGTGSVNLQGGTIETSTGSENVSSCTDAAAATVQGSLVGTGGQLVVNGNLCIASGLVDLDPGAYPGQAIVEVKGVTGATTSNDGDILVHSGGTLLLQHGARVVAHDVTRGAGDSYISLLGYGGASPIVVDGSSRPVHLPLLQLDTAGADPDNAFEVGELLASAGTIWADGRVALTSAFGASNVSTEGALVPPMTQIFGGFLEVSSDHALNVLNDAAVSMTEGVYDSLSPNRISGTVVFGNTSTFDTDKDVQTFGLLAFGTASDFTQTGGRLFEVPPNGTVYFYNDATADIDANIFLHEYSAGLQGGRLYVIDNAFVDVLLADDSAAYLGGLVHLANQAHLNIPMLLVRSSSDIVPARVNVFDEARLVVSSSTDTCVTPDLAPGAGGPVFSGQAQGCSWIYDYAEVTVRSRGLTAGACTASAPSCGTAGICLDLLGRERCDSDAVGACVCHEPGLFTNERFIVNVEQLSQSDARFPLGLTVDGGLMVKNLGPISTFGSTTDDIIDPRRSSAVTVMNSGRLYAYRIHAKTLGPDGYAGGVFLFNDGMIDVGTIDLDADSLLVFLGDDSRVHVQDLFGGQTGSTVIALPNTFPRFAPSGPADEGTPLGSACGHGGGASAGVAGNGAGGPGGVCTTCTTFETHPVSFDTALAFGRGGSAGGVGTGGSGGARVGAIQITGADGALIDLHSAFIADGQAAPDVACGGGGSSGGGIYISGDEIWLEPESTFSARGGDGAQNGGYIGGGGAGGNILIQYRGTVNAYAGTVEDALRDSDVRGGMGFEDGAHGSVVLAKWNDTTNQIEDLVSTYLVWKGDDPGGWFGIYGDWLQIDPVGVTVRGQVTDVTDIDLTVLGTISLVDSDYVQTAGTATIQANNIGLERSTWTSLDGSGMPTNTLILSTSAMSFVQDDSHIVTGLVLLDGAGSADWDISGFDASSASSIESYGLAFGSTPGVGDNIDELQIGPFGSLIGPVFVEANTSVALDLQQSVIDASGMGPCPGSPLGLSPGVDVTPGAGGGGYGGVGGSGSAVASGGTWYDSAFSPNLDGSPGGTASGAAGGCAGGPVIVNAPSCTILGDILSNGADGETSGANFGGGGSGGSIALDCTAVTMDAVNTDLVANGGASTGGGGGGGGRVIIHSSAYTDFDCQVSGGLGGIESGDVGTCGLLVDNAGFNSDLYVRHGFRLQGAEAVGGSDDGLAFTPLNSLTVPAGTRLTGHFNGAIDIDTVWQQNDAGASQWDPAGDAIVNVSGLLWGSDACVGHDDFCLGAETLADCVDSAVFAPDNLTLNVAVSADMRNSTCADGLVVRPLGGTTPSISFGLAASGINGPLVVGDFDIDGAANITLNDTFEVLLTGTGYEHGEGPGDGINADATGGGGGGGAHGGRGADGEISSVAAPGGVYYGSSHAPADRGSAGGAGNGGSVAAGGAGGGRLSWIANNIILKGLIDLDGASGVSAGAMGGGGGGAGGGALLEATTFTLDAATFSISADGGDGGVGTSREGGGGSGGRVLIVSHDASASGTTRAQSLANSLHAIASIDGGTGGANVASPGTMAVFLDRGDGDAVNDHLYAVSGWRNELADAPHTYEVYDLTRDAPIVDDGTDPVTISTEQALLSGVAWTADNDLTLTTSRLVVNASTLQVASFLNITTAALSGLDTATWSGSSAVAGSGITATGSGDSGWQLTTSSLETPGLIALDDLTNLDIFDGGSCSGAVRCGLYGNVVLTADSMTLDVNTEINADTAGNGPNTGPGAGLASATGGGGGGAYGGHGGLGAGGASGGDHYDSALQPTLDQGSGGGDGADAGAVGGVGGGVVDINVAGTALIDGRVSADGGSSSASGGFSGGGGSGGGIRLRADLLAGAGQFSAIGGDGLNALTRGGAGGGGRIAVFVTDLIGFTGVYQTTVAAGQGNTPALLTDYAERGTAGFIDTDDLNVLTVSSWRFESADVASYANYNNFSAESSSVDGFGVIQPTHQNITVELEGTFSLGNHVQWQTEGYRFILSADSFVADGSGGVSTVDTQGGDLIMALSDTFELTSSALVSMVSAADGSTGTLTVSGAADLNLMGTSRIEGDLVFVGDSVTTEVGTVIFADRGHAEGQGLGAPAPAVAAAGGSGGSHGGIGSRGDLNPNVGVENDTAVAPILAGSGGSSAHNGASPQVGTGGRGGGRIRLEATSNIDLAGIVAAPGSGGLVAGTYGGGGGAGGSVFISAPTVNTAAGAQIDVRGGSGGVGVDAVGGGGSGGRIALCSNTGALSGTDLFGGGAGGIAGTGASGTFTDTCVPTNPGTLVLIATSSAHMTDIQLPTTGADLPLMALSVTELSGNEGILLGDLSISADGSVDESSAQVQNWRVLVDANSNGISDAGDQLLDGPVDFAADNGTLTFGLSGHAVAASASVDLLIIADTNGAAGSSTISFNLPSDASLTVTGDTTSAPGQIVGAPVTSGVKTIVAAPIPAVASFTPSRQRNDNGFNIDVYGVNLAGVTSAQFNSVPSNTFSTVVSISDSHFSGSVVANAPPTIPGFYDLLATAGLVTNATSAMKFEFFAFCDTGLQGLCSVGEQIGVSCVQTVFPSAEICGNGLDESCDGADLSCTGVDDDGDTWAENQGDCDDADGANNPGMGLVCTSEESEYSLLRLSGVPRNISSHHLSEDTRLTTWRTDASASWYAMAGENVANSAAVFDGVQDYVEVAPTVSLGPQTYLSVLSWVHFDQLPSGPVALVYKGGPAPAQLEYGLTYESNRFRFLVRGVDGVNYQREASIPIILGRWYQLAGTYDSDTGEMRLYVDGILVDAATIPTSPAPTLGGSPLYVGGHVGGVFGSLNGKMDEFRIFGRVVTAAEIAADNSDLRQAIDSSLNRAEERIFLSFDTCFNDLSGQGNKGVPFFDARITGRSGRYEFPTVAFPVATSGGIDIFDENNKLWFRLPVGSGAGALQDGDIDFAQVANGILVVGSRSPTQGLTVFDFPADEIYRFTSAGREDYSGDFENLLTGSYGAPDGVWRLQANEITGLSVAPLADSVLIGVGQIGFLTGLDLGPTGGVAFTSLPAVDSEAVALVFGAGGDLYYGVNPTAGAPTYEVISDLAGWIAGGGGSLGVSAIVLPAGATTVNDADFTTLSATGSTYLLAVAHDAGITSGQASPAVAGGTEVTQTTTTPSGSSSDVASVWLDFDLQFSGIFGDGIVVYDHELSQVSQFIDDDYATTGGVARLDSLDVVGVAGFSNVAVATTESVQFFTIPLSQGTCSTGLVGACANGDLYPLPSAGETTCVQTEFESHELCGDAVDSDCDGPIDPPAAVCSTGIPQVDLGADLTFLADYCDPIPLTLPVPSVVDDTDPAPEVRCWSSQGDDVIVNGEFGDWDAGDEIGTGSNAIDVSTQYTDSTWSFFVSGVDVTDPNIALRVGISASDDGDGCWVPGGESGVSFVEASPVLPNWVIEVDNPTTYVARHCDSVGNTFNDEPALPLFVGAAAGGVELKLDLTDPLFAGTEISDPNGRNFIYVWVYRSDTGAVVDSFPASNPTGPGPGPVTFVTSTEVDRTVAPVSEAALGTFQYGCTATDFDGFIGTDSIAITVNKSTSPIVIAPPSIYDVPATAPETYVNMYCEGGDVTDSACAGGTLWTVADIVPDVPENCVETLTLTNDAPPGWLFSHSLPAAYDPHTITYTLTDGLGVAVTDTQEIRVRDYEAPSIIWALVGGVMQVDRGFGTEVWQWIDHWDDGGPNPIEESDLATALILDNADLGGDITCEWVEDISTTAFNPGTLVLLHYRCTDRSGNSETAQLWVMRRPSQTPFGDPTQNIDRDLTSYFQTSPTGILLEVGDDGVDGASGGCSVTPWVSVTSDDPAMVYTTLGDSYHYGISVYQEGRSTVTVTVISPCSSRATTVDYRLGIDTVSPVISAGFNEANGAPAPPDQPTDTSMYAGVYRLESSPTFTLAGRVEDATCGIATVTATLFQVDSSGNDVDFDTDDGPSVTPVAVLIDETHIPVGTPAEGPVMVSALPCSDPDWCSADNTGLEVPADTELAPESPYRIHFLVKDCAGNETTRQFYFDVLSLDRALDRMDTAINRWIARATAEGSGEPWDTILADLGDAQLIYSHARAAAFHGFLATAIWAMEGAGQFAQSALIDMSIAWGATDSDVEELTQKLIELATGARTETRAMFVALESAGFADLDQADLADDRILTAQTEEQIAPASALLELRAAHFHLDLADSGYASVTPDFEAAIEMLTRSIDQMYDYLQAVAASSEMFGQVEVDKVHESMFEARRTMWCQCDVLPGNPPCGPQPPDSLCENFGRDGTDTSPNSEELALNILRLMEDQYRYDLTEDVYVYMGSVSFNSAQAATVVVNEGLKNSRALVCREDDHPLIEAADAHWANMQAIREAMETDTTLINTYKAEATSDLTRCLVMYTYNAAYVTDSRRPDLYWYDPRSGNDYMNALSVPGCGSYVLNRLPGEVPDHDEPVIKTPPLVNATLIQWFDWQDTVNEWEQFCACSDTYRQSNRCYCLEDCE